jgi:signal recognition particle receptor subunit beta
MNDNKILFAGPQGVGVTTAIKTISDIKTSTREEKRSNANGNVVSIKMDYGLLKLQTGEEIYLYGTPDRETVKLVREELCTNCIGLVLLINNIETEPVNCMLQYIEYYQELVGENAIAVGLTRYDDSPLPDINEFHIALRERKLNIPVLAVNVLEKNDVITLIKTMLYNLDSGVD